MGITAKVIIPAKVAESLNTTQYTTNGVTTIIDKFTATNFSASPATLGVNLVSSGSSYGNQNLVVSNRTLAAGETYTFPEIVGQILQPGDSISTIAGTASAINIRASGREIA